MIKTNNLPQLKLIMLPVKCKVYGLETFLLYINSAAIGPDVGEFSPNGLLNF